MKKESNKLSYKAMLGYSIGAWGDYTAYGFIYSFLSFFLTTIAGVSPAVSGMIISAAVVWDAVTDPIAGVLMDNLKCKYGKRRPFIATSIIPLGASIVLLFLNIDCAQSLKNIYYFVLVLVFWTSYTIWNIPYYSLGAVIAKSDEERTKIAGIRQVAGFIGTFCSSTVPTFLVGKFLETGMKNDTAWFYIGVIVAAIVVITIVIMWRSTRGLEAVEHVAHKEHQSIKSLLSDIGKVMRLKPYLIVIVCALCMNVNMALFNSNVMYFGIYNLGVGEAQVSMIFLAQNITSIALVPILTKLGLKFDKKSVFVTCMCISGITMIAAKFIGISSLTMAIVYMIIVSIGSAAYWMFIFNFLYDVADYDEVKSGKRKDGIIMSFYSFLLKLGGAVASLVMGLALQAGGFVADAAEQSASALSTIESMFTLFPGIFVLISGLIVVLTPLTRKKMGEIQEQLSAVQTTE